MSGTLYGVGVGPGDPDLITLKAYKILQTVPVIAYPAPERGDSLARRVAAPHIPQGRREIVIRIPLDSKRFPDRGSYDKAAEQIATALRGGEDVAVICEVLWPTCGAVPDPGAHHALVDPRRRLLSSRRCSRSSNRPCCVGVRVVHEVEDIGTGGEVGGRRGSGGRA